MNTERENIVREYAFLPWLFLDGDHDVGRFTVRRVGRPEGPFHRVVPPEADKESLYGPIVGMLSGYVYFNGEVRDGWSVVASNGRLTYPVQEIDQRTRLRNDIYNACELLAFASISCNELFRPFGHYANSSVFRPIFQEVKSVAGYTAFLQRRKVLSVSHGWSSDTQVPEPLNCHALGTRKVNSALLHALERLCLGPECDSPLAARVRRAIHVYLRAYTDEPSNRLEDEVVYQVAALEALFGSKGKTKTATKLTELFASDLDPTPFRSCARYRSECLHGQSDADSLTFWNWFVELYDLRSTYHHCDIYDPARDVWTPTEHCTMSASVFVSAVIYLLAKADLYKPDSRDRAMAMAYGRILCAQDWPGGREPGTTGYVTWEEIVSTCRFELACSDVSGMEDDE
ncbi:MAG: hypothetical protein H6839_01195 [Planctomycetes bacterium]|nr:hypothetical protein [Planctomycetota bacterium]